MGRLDEIRCKSPNRMIGSLMILAAMVVLSVLVTTIPDDRDQYLDNGGDPPVNDAISAGDTAWMMMSCALVLLMTPGLSFFYGGMVRKTSLISTLLQSYVIMGIVLILWVILGYSLAFGDDWGDSHIVGNPHTHYFFRNVGAGEPGDNIPETVFALFQATFAMITPALITGSIVERANFNAVMLFVVLWHLIVYCPIAHMEWGSGGLIAEFGHKDFAGGTVVHMSSGYSALVLAKLIGKRKADPENLRAPAHVPYVLLGAALLWFGWFGFNGGSALASDALAGQALITTNVAAGTSMVTWILWDYVRGRPASAIGASAGLVVGLVCITPGCGFVTVGGALCMGMIGSVVSNVVLELMEGQEFVDDTLDVFACHGVGGTVGMILTACFTTDRVQSTKHESVFQDDPIYLDGLFYGEGRLFGNTIAVAVLTIPFFMLMTFLIYHFVNFFVPFRVSEDDEMQGLDGSYHGEKVGTMELPGEERKMMEEKENV